MRLRASKLEQFGCKTCSKITSSDHAKAIAHPPCGVCDPEHQRLGRGHRIREILRCPNDGRCWPRPSSCMSTLKLLKFSSGRAQIQCCSCASLTRVLCAKNNMLIVAADRSRRFSHRRTPKYNRESQYLEPELRVPRSANTKNRAPAAVRVS